MSQLRRSMSHEGPNLFPLSPLLSRRVSAPREGLMGPYALLLIDDDPGVRQAVGKFFEARDY